MDTEILGWGLRYCGKLIRAIYIFQCTDKHKRKKVIVSKCTTPKLLNSFKIIMQIKPTPIFGCSSLVLPG